MNINDYWNDSLSVGVDEIDKQHKKLIGAIGELLEACKKGRGNTEIKKTLDFVGSYTKEHFSAEERLQQKSAYPGFEAHKKLHAAFVKSVDALEKEFAQKGPDTELTGKMNKVLMDWLVNHIKTEDKKLAAHLKGKAV